MSIGSGNEIGTRTVKIFFLIFTTREFEFVSQYTQFTSKPMWALPRIFSGFQGNKA